MTTRSELDRKLFAAVERLARAMRVARQHLATTHKLSVLQVQLIEHLAAFPPRRVGVLAEEFDVTQPTISDAIASLEDKGVVASQRDPNDGRASVIELTPEGHSLSMTLAAGLAPLLDDERTSSSDDEAIALRVMLEEIRRLQAHGVITVNRSCLSCQHFKPPEKADASGHCLLLDEPLLPRDLRVDCPDHVTLPPIQN